MGRLKKSSETHITPIDVPKLSLVAPVTIGVMILGLLAALITALLLGIALPQYDMLTARVIVTTRHADIKAPHTGRITDVHVASGDLVQKDQPLLRFDIRTQKKNSHIEILAPATGRITFMKKFNPDNAISKGTTLFSLAEITVQMNITDQYNVAMIKNTTSKTSLKAILIDTAGRRTPPLATQRHSVTTPLDTTSSPYWQKRSQVPTSRVIFKLSEHQLQFANHVDLHSTHNAIILVSANKQNLFDRIWETSAPKY